MPHFYFVLLELDEFLLELDEDVEGMQSTIYFLQQQLRQSREQLATVQKENDILRNARSNPEDSSISCENVHLNSNVNESTSEVEPRVTRILNGGLHHSIIIPSSLEAENCSGTFNLFSESIKFESPQFNLLQSRFADANVYGTRFNSLF